MLFCLGNVTNLLDVTPNWLHILSMLISLCLLLYRCFCMLHHSMIGIWPHSQLHWQSGWGNHTAQCCYYAALIPWLYCTMNIVLTSTCVHYLFSYSSNHIVYIMWPLISGISLVNICHWTTCHVHVLCDGPCGFNYSNIISISAVIKDKSELALFPGPAEVHGTYEKASKIQGKNSGRWLYWATNAYC